MTTSASPSDESVHERPISGIHLMRILAVESPDCSWSIKRVCAQAVIGCQPACALATDCVVWIIKILYCLNEGIRFDASMADGQKRTLFFAATTAKCFLWSQYRRLKCSNQSPYNTAPKPFMLPFIV